MTTNSARPGLDPGEGLAERIVRLPDGRRLRAVVAGGTGPTVVFEAGLGSTAGSWVVVQRLVAARARTVSYDRAGYGGSDADAANRNVGRLAEDLDGLLTALAIDEPVVLVGHSWGGPVVRQFAARRPDRVRAVVLVDASRTEIFTPSSLRAIRTIQTALAAMGRLQLGALLRRLPVRGDGAAGVSSADRRVMSRDTSTATALDAARREALQIPASIPAVRSLEIAGLPEVPLLVIAGGLKADSGRRPAMISLGRAEAESRPLGRFVLVDGVGHMVQQKRPHPTAEAILELVSSLASPAVPSRPDSSTESFQ